MVRWHRRLAADHVEAVGWLLPVNNLIGLLVLDATGVRVGELEAARVGDLWAQARLVQRPSEFGDPPVVGAKMITLCSRA